MDTIPTSFSIYVGGYFGGLLHPKVSIHTSGHRALSIKLGPNDWHYGRFPADAHTWFDPRMTEAKHGLARIPTIAAYHLCRYALGRLQVYVSAIIPSPLRWASSSGNRDALLLLVLLLASGFFTHTHT